MHFLRTAALLSCGVVALAFTTGALAADDASPADATFRAGTSAWLAAYNAGDVEAIVAMYTPDAVLMPPDAPAASGHPAIREFLARDIAASKAAGVTLADGASDIGASGDLGWHAGSFAVRDAAGATVGAGKYLEVWQRAGGKWLMVRDTWNNDAAPAPAPPPAE